MQEITTAQALANFRAELCESGMPECLVNDLVLAAANELFACEGLRVKATL